MDAAALRTAVLDYLNKEANVPAEGLSGDDQDLIAEGIIDSFGLLGLVTHLEATLCLRIDASDIDPGNFNTVAKIVKMLVAKK